MDLGDVRHVIQRAVNPRVLSRMAPYDDVTRNIGLESNGIRL